MWIGFTPNAAVLFVDVAIQPEVHFIGKQNSLLKIGNNGNLVWGPFDESTPCLMIVLMNCQTKLRISHLTAVKSVAILESNTNLNFYAWKKTLFIIFYTLNKRERKWYTLAFLAESKNCSKVRPPAKMQASHRWRRDCQILANTPGISRISPATTQSSQPGSRRGLSKLASSYGARQRSLGRRVQARVAANLKDLPVQFIVLDMLYPMRFAHLC
ncbi:alpha-2 adrenergic receptor [Trichonephila clavipes]|uniref:Alpha-2 adrenergic receptor n=1 Tax=Trichonephila clavipes TaxID=2585209 RepID=A0A8X6SZM2_TRICX|nr:alpha-2 adrenergic receptor [Trichonephila clavipes]